MSSLLLCVFGLLCHGATSEMLGVWIFKNFNTRSVHVKEGEKENDNIFYAFVPNRKGDSPNDLVYTSVEVDRVDIEKRLWAEVRYYTGRSLVSTTYHIPANFFPKLATNKAHFFDKGVLIARMDEGDYRKQQLFFSTLSEGLILEIVTSDIVSQTALILFYTGGALVYRHHIGLSGDDASMDFNEFLESVDERWKEVLSAATMLEGTTDKTNGRTIVNMGKYLKETRHQIIPLTVFKKDGSYYGGYVSICSSKFMFFSGGGFLRVKKTSGDSVCEAFEDFNPGEPTNGEDIGTENSLMSVMEEVNHGTDDDGDKEKVTGNGVDDEEDTGVGAGSSGGEKGSDEDETKVGNNGGEKRSDEDETKVGNNGGEEKGGLSTGAIVGIAVGSSVGVILIIGLVAFFLKKKNSN